MSKHKRTAESRENEVIGGGYFVFCRGQITNRIRINALPFEHGSYDSALVEATRLSRLYPHNSFTIFNALEVITTLEQEKRIANLRQTAIGKIKEISFYES